MTTDADLEELPYVTVGDLIWKDGTRACAWVLHRPSGRPMAIGTKQENAHDAAAEWLQIRDAAKIAAFANYGHPTEAPIMGRDALITAAKQAILGFNWSNYGLDEVEGADQEYAEYLATAVVDAIRAVPRWRPIDAVGNVDAAREPDKKDDPDEGETGPEEIRA